MRQLDCGTRKFDHITPILASLHWLPITFRSDFKVLLLTYKALHGLSPSYLIIPYSPSWSLRSSGDGLSLPKVKKSSTERLPIEPPSYGIGCHLWSGKLTLWSYSKGSSKRTSTILHLECENNWCESEDYSVCLCFSYYIIHSHYVLFRSISLFCLI